jgi:hypothetical protein
MKKPSTQKEWAAYRAISDCDIGLKTIEGKIDPPFGYTRQEHAIYSLLQAVQSLAHIQFIEDDIRSAKKEQS